MKNGLGATIEREAAYCRIPVLQYADPKIKFNTGDKISNSPFLPHSNDPEVVAELIDKIVTSKEFRENLVDQEFNFVKAVADPVRDLNYPMKGPFTPIRTGSADAHQLGISICKKAKLLPAIIAQQVDHIDKNITSISTSAKELINFDENIVNIAAANLPLRISSDSKLHVFRPVNGTEENYALEIGSINRADPVLCRLHSACFTGDLLGSLKCDCGEQLRKALRTIGEEKQGILLYLNQEGRGIGLANKMRAYALQNQGFDTVEANHRLGFEDEERDFEIGAKILKELGFKRIKLLTNNPKKINMMEAFGIEVVKRIPLKTELTPENTNYLATKVKKSGHFN